MRRNSAIRKLVHSFGLESDSFRSTEGERRSASGLSSSSIQYEFPRKQPGGLEVGLLGRIRPPGENKDNPLRMEETGLLVLRLMALCVYG